MKNLLIKIDAFPAQLSKWHGKNHAAKIEYLITEISLELAPVICQIPAANEASVSTFLVSAHEYLQRQYDVFNPALDNTPALAAKLFSLTTFKLLVKRQIDLTQGLKILFTKVTNSLTHEHCKQFMNNLSRIQTCARNIPIDALDDNTKHQIRYYISLYFEYLSDHGWTPAMPESLEIDDADLEPRHQPTSSTHRNNLNFLEFKRFIAEIVSQFAADYQTGLDDTLVNLVTFCNSLQVTDASKIISNNIEMLCAAIKKDDVPTIIRIVSAEPNILSKQCPDSFDVNEISFTPLMLAAKHSHNAETITNGLFCVTKNKKEQLIHLKIKANGCNILYKNYNSLMIAARWGRPAVFQYFVSLIGALALKPEILKVLILAVCHTSLPYSGSNNPVIKIAQLAKRDARISQLITLLQVGDNDYLQKCFPDQSIPIEVKAKLAVLVQKPAPVTDITLASSSTAGPSVANARPVNKKRRLEDKEEAPQINLTGNTPEPNIFKRIFKLFSGTAIIPELETASGVAVPSKKLA